tara:strand:+ start:3159 stop:3317 length:159 start_codon:yes stop_codon:yes gene_type:complete
MVTKQWLRNPKWREDVSQQNNEGDEGQQQQEKSSEEKDGEEIRNQEKGSEQG